MGFEADAGRLADLDVVSIVRPLVPMSLSDTCHSTLMYLCVINSTYSTAFYTPTILVELGYTAVKAQLMSFPPYAVAVVSCLSFCMLSDRFKHRYGFLMGGVLMGTIGYAIMLSQQANPGLPVGAKYFAMFLLISAPQIVQPLTVVSIGQASDRTTSS